MKGLKRKPKGVIVFVKNKLISLDSIAPILLELKENNNISSTIVVFDKLTHDGIKANVVLRDLIKLIGREIYITRGIRNKIFRKFVAIVSLIGIFLKFIYGYKVIHFGALNVWPLNYLFCFNRKNIFFAQQDSFRHTWSKFYYQLGILKKKSTPAIGNNIIAFNDMMEELDQYSKSKDIFFFGETRTRKIWLDYCNQNTYYYLNKYHADVDFSKGCAVFILSTFEDMKSINTAHNMLNLFYETIKALSLMNIPVLLKPHVFTDLGIVKKAIKDNKNMHITYLHPTILALNSTFFVANAYSTTFADAHSLGLPTIEYTDYSKEMLEATSGKSLGHEYVDYFINNNQSELEKKIEDILLGNKTISSIGTSNDDSGLLRKLSE